MPPSLADGYIDLAGDWLTSHLLPGKPPCVRQSPAQSIDPVSTAGVPGMAVRAAPLEGDDRRFHRTAGGRWREPVELLLAEDLL